MIDLLNIILYNQKTSINNLNMKLFYSKFYKNDKSNVIMTLLFYEKII